MKITIAKNEREFDYVAGLKIASQMISKPDSVIGLSTGDTTGGMHRAASELYMNYPFDTSRVTLFGVDEFAMVPPDFGGTCAARLREQIVVPMDIRPENFIIPKTLCDDYGEECRHFEGELMCRGGIDLQMLGIGMDGHLGMNLPGSSFSSVTRLVKLSGELEQRIRTKNNYPAPLPLEGTTLGIRTIMNIRHIVLVAKGKHKASIIKQAVFGPITEQVPASILQLHPNCEFLLDPEAAAEIKDLL